MGHGTRVLPLLSSECGHSAFTYCDELEDDELEDSVTANRNQLYRKVGFALPRPTMNRARDASCADISTALTLLAIRSCYGLAKKAESSSRDPLNH